MMFCRPLAQRHDLRCIGRSGHTVTNDAGHQRALEGERYLNGYGIRTMP
jgi:hypothetical protein